MPVTAVGYKISCDYCLFDTYFVPCKRIAGRLCEIEVVPRFINIIVY